MRAHEAFAHLVSVLRAFSLSVHASTPWTTGVDFALVAGIADTGHLDVDLPELFVETAQSVKRLGAPGIALFLDDLQDAAAADLTALCLASHAVAQVGTRLMVIGAGLPHLPMRLADARSYAERLYEYHVVDRLDREASVRALVEPARREGAQFDPDALELLYTLSEGYPYFLQAYGQCAWDVAAASPIGRGDVEVAALVAQEQLDVGFFGTRYDRATPKERAYLTAMAGVAAGGEASTADIAQALGRSARSLSAARDGLIRKGLVFGSARGRLAFTVPQFAEYLLRQPGD